MTITFKYKSVKRPSGNEVKSPMIPVTLIGRSSITPEFIALLDSGADVSIIPLDVAELLNLNLNTKVEKSRGIGGEVEVKTTKMDIKIQKGHEGFRYTIPVQVVLNETKGIPVLLGRAGFFEHFRITFDQHNQIISLKPAVENKRY
jgi:predicted aspartyl protease